MIWRRLHVQKRASILVGLLWCIVLLALVVVGVLHTARMDLLVVKNYGDRVQAHYLAVAGVEKAKALLYQDARERSKSQRSYSGTLSDSPQDFRDVHLDRGIFRVIHRGRNDEGGGILYGVSDEGSRLNVNTASADALGKIEFMTPDVAASIIDWRDNDDTVTPGGAEAEYYAGFQPPYEPRNAAIQTMRELLMVRGVSRERLLGVDRYLNGIIDMPDTLETDSDLGWAGMLTVNSSVANVSASGSDRINVKTANENELAGVHGITSEIAKAIISYRGQNQDKLKSIADLLDIPTLQSQSQLRLNGGNRSSGSNDAGPKVIDDELLMRIGDDLTVDSKDQLDGAINVNSASREVLMCLPGISRELAQAIVSYRQSSGFFSNIAYLLKVPGMNHEIFKQVAPLITTRSETFRILSEGVVSSTGTRQRIEEIVHIDLQNIKTVSYREDDL